MKKFLLYCMAFLFAGFTFTSCKKNASTDFVVGSWHLSKRIVYIEGASGIEEHFVFDLNLIENHSFIWDGENEHAYGTWFLNDKQLNLSIEGGGATINGTYYAYSQETRVYAIQKLTASEMVLKEDLGDGYFEYYYTK